MVSVQERGVHFTPNILAFCLMCAELIKSPASSRRKHPQCRNELFNITDQQLLVSVATFKYFVNNFGYRFVNTRKCFSYTPSVKVMKSDLKV